MKKFEITANEKETGKECIKVIFATTKQKALIYLEEMGYENPTECKDISDLRP
ncbi:MAG: hypothetical protein RLP14_05955 [Owenweeksia sp.]